MDDVPETEGSSKRKIIKKLRPDFISSSKLRTPKKKITPKTNRDGFICGVCNSETFLKQNPNVNKCRLILDSKTNKLIRACNACGLKFKRRRKGVKVKASVKTKTNSTISEDKKQYLESAKSYALEISKLVKDDIAKNFYCPKFRTKPCGCLQTFLQFDKGNIEETTKRVNLLLRYHKKSLELISENNDSNTRSHEYDNFVLTNRDYLKTQLNLCELAVQKILRYRNRLDQWLSVKY